jgi:plasmid maintenance system antidote protein VapI
MDTEPRVNVNWFKDQLRDRQISQRKLGELMALDPSKISLLLSGKRRMTHAEIARIADIFGVTVEEVMLRLGTRVSAAEACPIVATFDADGTLAERKGGGRAPLPMGMPAKTVAARCEDTQALYFGWTLYYAPATGVSPDALGKLSIVKTARGADLVRFVKHGFERGLYQLVSMAGEITENVDIVSAVPVSWIRS